MLFSYLFVETIVFNTARLKIIAKDIKSLQYESDEGLPAASPTMEVIQMDKKFNIDRMGM